MAHKILGIVHENLQQATLINNQNESPIKTSDTLSMHQMFGKYLLLTRYSFLEVRAPPPSELIF